MIGIVGAMKEEVEALIAALEAPVPVQGRLSRYYRGRIEGVEVVVAKTGVGKVLSALTAAEMIERFGPTRLIFTGIAGGIGPGLAIGDLVVGTDSIQYDMDVSGLGMPIGKIPFSNYREIAADEELLSAMQGYTADGYRIHFGRILTGDIFVTDRHSERLAPLFKELQGLAVEMEGASVALTAAVFGVPCLILRFISDAADGSAPKDFQAFLEGCSQHALEVVRFLLTQL